MRAQGLQAQRLGYPGVHAHGGAALIFIAQGVGGNADNRQVGIAPAQGRGQFIAIEDGHVDIGQNHVEPTGQPLCQGLFAIGGHHHRAAEGFELLFDDRRVDEVVFGHQNAQIQLAQGFAEHGRGLAGGALLFQVDGPGNRANIVQIDFPACTRVLRRVAATRRGNDLRATPGAPVTVRRYLKEHCRLRWIKAYRAAIDAETVEPGAEVLCQFRGLRAHLDTGSRGCELRQVGQCTGSDFQGQLQAEAAAQTGVADHVQLAAHQFCQPFANGQAQPGPTLAGGVAGLVKRVKQLLLLGRRNADARIADLPGQEAGVGLGLDYVDTQHHPAILGELDGIAQQIVKHLADAQGVAAHLVRQCRIDAGIQLQPLAQGEGTVGANAVLDQL